MLRKLQEYWTKHDVPLGQQCLKTSSTLHRRKYLYAHKGANKHIQETKKVTKLTKPLATLLGLAPLKMMAHQLCLSCKSRNWPGAGGALQSLVAALMRKLQVQESIPDKYGGGCDQEEAVQAGICRELVL
eukprot:1302511-Amphidinium_carterae.1